MLNVLDWSLVLSELILQERAEMLESDAMEELPGWIKPEVQKIHTLEVASTNNF